MMFRKTAPLLLGIIVSMGLSACSLAPAMGSTTPVPSTLPDGVYPGKYGHFPNLARVEITIKNGRIIHIRLVHHGIPRARTIAQRIINEQSTDVDAVSGATNSSIVIMNAAQVAIDNAQDAN